MNRSVKEKIRLLILLGILAVLFVLLLKYGLAPFGPKVAYSHSEVIGKAISNIYMIFTNEATFETDPNTWNDMKIGQSYDISTRGKKWTIFGYEYYPRIIKCKESNVM